MFISFYCISFRTAVPNNLYAQVAIEELNGRTDDYLSTAHFTFTKMSVPIKNITAIGAIADRQGMCFIQDTRATYNVLGTIEEWTTKLNQSERSGPTNLRNVR